MLQINLASASLRDLLDAQKKIEEMIRQRKWEMEDTREITKIHVQIAAQDERSLDAALDIARRIDSNMVHETFSNELEEEKCGFLYFRDSKAAFEFIETAKNNTSFKIIGYRPIQMKVRKSLGKVSPDRYYHIIGEGVLVEITEIPENVTFCDLLALARSYDEIRYENSWGDPNKGHLEGCHIPFLEEKKADAFLARLKEEESTRNMKILKIRAPEF